jgi:hypothetical protein
MDKSILISKSKYTYLDVIEFAKKYDCEILNYKNPLEILSNKLIIKCKCGHFTTETINNFIKKKIGIYCKDCMGKIVSNSNDIEFTCSNSKCKKIFIPNEKILLYCCKFCSYSREKDLITKIKISNKVKLSKINISKLFDKEIYKKGNIYLNNLIGKQFNFEITNRCCQYNHIIKPINKLNEFNNQTNINKINKIWLPVEIKYSKSSSSEHYYFTMRKNYKNILIICVSLEENKIWIFPPNILEYTTKLKINKIKPNRFEQYYVNPDNIINLLVEYYNKLSEIMVDKNDNLMENISDSNSHIKVEYEHKIQRLKYIDFIDFQNPISNFEPYNFIVNGYKVQECVSFISNSNHQQIVSIHKKLNGFSLPFDYTDSDFYWIHERNCDNFYLIPSNIMYENRLLDSESQKGKTALNLDTNQYWLFKYKFSYITINSEPYKSTLMKVFGIK